MKDFKITDVRINPGDAGYLIDDGETAILYDTGFGFTGADMAKKIKDLIRPAISLIFESSPCKFSIISSVSGEKSKILAPKL